MKLLFLLSILFCLAQGCSTLAHYTGYIKDNIKIIGARNAYSSKAVFYDMEIKYNDKNQINTNLPSFSIKLLNGIVIFSKQFKYKYISSLPNIKKYISKDDAKITDYMIDGFLFSFYGKNLIFFRTDRFQGGKEYTPMIGNKDGTIFYKFPLTQNQIEKIFGKPDKYENKHS